MNPLIEMCRQTFLNGGSKIFEKYDKDSRIDIILNDCLSYCEICRSQLFVLAEGELLLGKTEDELFLKISTWIEENTI